SLSRQSQTASSKSRMTGRFSISSSAMMNTWNGVTQKASQTDSKKETADAVSFLICRDLALPDEPARKGACRQFSDDLPAFRTDPFKRAEKLHIARPVLFQDIFS